MEALGVADRAEAGHDDVARTAALERAAGAGREVGPAVRDDVVAEARAQRAGDVVADLVAAGAGPRPDGGGEARPDAPCGSLEHAGHEPAPARVHDRQSSRADERRREAVGAVRDQGQAGLRGRQRVALGPRGRGVEVRAGTAPASTTTLP